MTSETSPHDAHPTFHVRQARQEDAEQLHSVAAESFPLACPPGSTAEDVAAFIAANLSVVAFERYLGDPARTLFLVESEQRVLGYSMLIAEEPSDPDVVAALSRRPTIELSKFYLVSDGHGRGIAAELMAATLDGAALRGATGVWLGVNQQNARANRFYEKHGFATTGTKRFRLGDGWEEDFVKERAIA